MKSLTVTTAVVVKGDDVESVAATSQGGDRPLGQTPPHGGEVRASNHLGPSIFRLDSRGQRAGDSLPVWATP
jgi:hypothetical protein